MLLDPRAGTRRRDGVAGPVSMKVVRPCVSIAHRSRTKCRDRLSDESVGALGYVACGSSPGWGDDTPGRMAGWFIARLVVYWARDPPLVPSEERAMTSWRWDRAGNGRLKGGFSVRVVVFAAAVAMTFALAGATARAIEPQVVFELQAAAGVQRAVRCCRRPRAGLTVTPIYWAPSGGKHAFPAGLRASSMATSPTSPRRAAAPATCTRSTPSTTRPSAARRPRSVYRIQAGTPIVDTDAFPSNGCTPASGYTACITDRSAAD